MRIDDFNYELPADLIAQFPTEKRGESKLLKQCSLPLTGKAVVHRIITNLGVLDVVPGGLKIIELAEGVTMDEIKAVTEATLV